MWKKCWNVFCLFSSERASSWEWCSSCPPYASWEKPSTTWPPNCCRKWWELSRTQRVRGAEPEGFLMEKFKIVIFCAVLWDVFTAILSHYLKDRDYPQTPSFSFQKRENFFQIKRKRRSSLSSSPLSLQSREKNEIPQFFDKITEPWDWDLILLTVSFCPGLYGYMFSVMYLCGLEFKLEFL